MPEFIITNATNSIAAGAIQTRAVAELRSTSTIRNRAQALLARARRGESEWFNVNDGAMLTAAALVAELTRARYPNLAIPYHSRWRHFEAGGADRLAQLNAALSSATARDKARAQIDLALISVLLDAGAGPDWCYLEAASGEHPAQEYGRSEGLGVASFHAFMDGLFSSDPARPLQADAAGLLAVTAERLAEAFQVAPDNPLIGVDGRAALLRRLGQALQDNPALFGQPGRPGHLFDRLVPGGGGTVQAQDILSLLLTGLAPIWPAQNALAGEPLGDCWRHPAAGGEADGPSCGWMPFHKLSQWLTYSLLEPFEWAGVKVEGLDALTGLPEYRNGGLFLDAGVLMLKNPALADSLHAPGDELIVEWRALTVALLDELAPLVREQLGLSAEQMPLACVLEGGTWAAGRVLAQQLHGGQPPLNIKSDGTVF
ncbi:MAG: URC4/urg3 family protein [Polaromonas sp.]|uniref:URC4/urg3 family protein n=1 Tax=Polaromonas sp. TaxID=1869339 RepID=UPI002735EAFA|nr:URC4/urg3 family protein [Polaromonas sp.]MDP2817099.1 URC4/urg3 family protein [Polaromonas sp.]